jgi:hypothetical protein
MNQGIGMNEFDGARRMHGRRDVKRNLGLKNPRRFQAKNWPHSFPAGEYAITHRGVNRQRLGCFSRK